MSAPVATATLRTRLLPVLLAPMIANRSTCAGLLGAVAVHGLMVAAGLPGFDCPIRAATGVPCPGCGLSRAGSALLRADLATMARYHAFAPVFLLIGVLMVLAVFLPELARNKLVQSIGKLEQKFAFFAILLWVLAFYWLYRLMTGGTEYIMLMAA